MEKKKITMSVVVSDELLKATQLAKQQKGINWSFEIRGFIEQRLKDIKSSNATAQRQQP